MNKPNIKIFFTDMWFPLTHENIKASRLYIFAAESFNVEITDVDPDIVFYSKFGFEHLKYSCPRVFYTGENKRPKFNECDYSFSFDYPVTARNYRLPLYRMYGEYDQLFTPRQPDSVLAENRKFCSFVNSNPDAKERINLFDLLCEYKRVDSGGKVRNNIGQRVADKNIFISQYKFNIAFENSSHPGYATEKLMQALIANTVPIYWGDPKIAADFNAKAFINVHDFESMEDVVAHVKEVDQNEELYRQYLAEPFLPDGEEIECCKEENIVKKFREILTEKRHFVPVSKKKRQILIYKYKLLKYRLKGGEASRERSLLQS